QLPSPAIGAAHAVTTREAGHARERHRPLPTEESWVIESGRDLSGEGESSQGQRTRRHPTTLYWAGPAAPFDEPIALRLLRCAGVGAARVGEGGVWASGAGASPLRSCSIARKRATFFRCWSQLSAKACPPVPSATK